MSCACVPTTFRPALELARRCEIVVVVRIQIEALCPTGIHKMGANSVSYEIAIVTTTCEWYTHWQSKRKTKPLHEINADERTRDF